VNRSGAYDLMEREYVTAPPENEDDFTLTKIAKRHGRSPSSVARMSRIHDWPAKRAAYRSESTELIVTLDRDAYASRVHELHGKTVKAAEVTIDAYIDAVEKKMIVPSAGDAHKLIQLAREIVNKPLGEPEGGQRGGPLPPGLNISPDQVGPFLDRLAGLARERLESGRGDGDLVAAAAPDREGRRLRVR
jgi:hypothetical protein